MSAGWVLRAIAPLVVTGNWRDLLLLSSATWRNNRFFQAKPKLTNRNTSSLCFTMQVCKSHCVHWGNLRKITYRWMVVKCSSCRLLIYIEGHDVCSAAEIHFLVTPAVLGVAWICTWRHEFSRLYLVTNEPDINPTRSLNPLFITRLC